MRLVRLGEVCAWTEEGRRRRALRLRCEGNKRGSKGQAGRERDGRDHDIPTFPSVAPRVPNPEKTLS